MYFDVLHNIQNVFYSIFQAHVHKQYFGINNVRIMDHH